jgi:hypothetical protein
MRVESELKSVANNRFLLDAIETFARRHPAT